jgi:hypothetical protein
VVVVVVIVVAVVVDFVTITDDYPLFVFNDC